MFPSKCVCVWTFHERISASSLHIGMSSGRRFLRFLSTLQMSKSIEESALWRTRRRLRYSIACANLGRIWHCGLCFAIGLGCVEILPRSEFRFCWLQFHGSCASAFTILWISMFGLSDAPSFAAVAQGVLHCLFKR